ncbi:hypothetical protein GpartN1_g3252.t1 [Galdieria partita]|uniref:Uncharacterized protein n=1 Tax=Galdieria partita TaxID=83374 RepID=A0A9C7PX75_9RHOD|nr:hypothetical protein GpartN1_g3252.t1 [Galdieria partita]
MEEELSKSDRVYSERGDEERSGTKLLSPSDNNSKGSSHSEKPRYAPFFTFISTAKKSIGSKLEHAKDLVKKDGDFLAEDVQLSGSPSRNTAKFDVASCQIRRSKSVEGFPLWADSFRLLRQFRVTGGHPLYSFCQRNTGNVFFITSKTIETFDSYCNKILDIRLPVAWEDPSIVAESPDDVKAPKRFTHVGGVGGPQVIPALTACYIEHLDEVVVAHEDGSLRSYCCSSGSMGVERRNSCLAAFRSKDSSRSSVEKRSQLPSSQRSVSIGSYKDFLITGCADGCIRIWHFDIVEDSEGNEVDTIVLTETYEPSLGSLPLMLKPTITSVSVSSLPSEMLSSDGLNDSAVAVFYANAEGYSGGYSITRQWTSPCVAAHSGPVTGLVALLNGLILLSVGRDGMLSVTETVSGRCMARKRLHYIPTVLFHLKLTNIPSEDDIVKMRELHFLVGGSEGQIELYRLVVMSLSRLEFQLVRKLHERTKNRRAAVSSLVGDLDASLIIATFSDKIVRMWRINEIDSAMLCMQTPPETPNPAVACFEGPQACFTRENVVSILEPIPFRTRLALYEGLIEAQRVLALALQDSIGLSEQAKDSVVSDFERIQTHFQQRVEKLDSELQITLERIRHRYYHCLVEDNSKEQGLFEFQDVQKRNLFCSALSNTGKELAAFEVNWALYKHHHYLEGLCREVSLQLRASLVNILQRANSQGAKDVLQNFPSLGISE